VTQKKNLDTEMGVKKTDGVNYDLQGKSVVPLAKKSHRLLEMGFFNFCFGTGEYPPGN